MAFTETLGLRELDDDEIKQVAGDHRILSAQWALGRVKGKR
jgi:hypothetical protein